MASATKSATMKVIKEGLAEVLCDSSVFYNPVQEFNRDMSIAAINTWIAGQAKPLEKVNILEGLAATGLRSMRYAKEVVVPEGTGLKIIANDFDPNAVETIKQNITYNNVADKVESSVGDARLELLFLIPSYIMYKSAHDKARFQVIDLDPYGSASQFIDSAVSSVENGGLLCITCTDMRVLAGGETEACFAKYGGMFMISLIEARCQLGQNSILPRDGPTSRFACCQRLCVAIQEVDYATGILLYRFLLQNICPSGLFT
jgi:tRNA (guanine26-N2/guanine27-N2)-dimethyltransferase